MEKEETRDMSCRLKIGAYCWGEFCGFHEESRRMFGMR